MPTRHKSKGKPTQKRRKVTAVPRGLQTITPHLSFDGAVRAIDFYKKAFGAREVMREMMPDGKIMHARLKIGDSMIFLADHFGEPTPTPPLTNMSLHVYVDDVDRLWRRAISAGATVEMPLADQFWGERYGQLIDPFGHHWSLSMRIPMSRQEADEKREEALAMLEEAEGS